MWYPIKSHIEPNEQEEKEVGKPDAAALLFSLSHGHDNISFSGAGKSAKLQLFSGWLEMKCSTVTLYFYGGDPMIHLLPWL